MHSALPDRKLTDAIDLLRMIEHVVEGCAKSSPKGTKVVPWGGLKLTLSQCAELLEEVSLTLDDDDELPDDEEFDSQEERISQKSVARRIRPIPTSNSQIRELRPPVQSAFDCSIGV